MEKTVYQVMEPIRIKVEIRNVSDRKSRYHITGDIYRTIEINAYTSKLNGSAVVGKTSYYRHSRWEGVGGGVTQWSDFAPGDVIRYELIANLPNDMSHPDEYSFFVETYTAASIFPVTTRTPIVARSKEMKVKVVDLPRTLPLDVQEQMRGHSKTQNPN